MTHTSDLECLSKENRRNVIGYLDKDFVSIVRGKTVQVKDRRFGNTMVISHRHAGLAFFGEKPCAS